jgi:hypothetical protein
MAAGAQAAVDTADPVIAAVTAPVAADTRAAAVATRAVAVVAATPVVAAATQAAVVIAADTRAAVATPAVAAEVMPEAAADTPRVADTVRADRTTKSSSPLKPTSGAFQRRSSFLASIACREK